ncbi:MAG: serine/threonine-protein kinase [candidate division KSB1 bacterium]
MKKIGNYQLIAEIKRSEHGATYRGWDAHHQRVVLLKTFKSREENCAPRFAQEAAAYARIDHPNVVQLWDYGFDEGVCFLALDFIAGQDLRHVLQHASRNGALPLEIAVAILYEALLGLAEIHKQNIIHRDLKPENILLSHEGQLKLCDFDLALQEEHALSGAGLTGSPGYVAPEVVLGEKLTPAADIFSLGVVFYEMLAGARPFQAATPGGEMNAIVRLAPVPLKKILPEAPAPVEALLDHMLAKRASERRATILELERHFDLGTQQARTQLIRRYLSAPENYQATGLIARAPARNAARASRLKWRWAYAASFAGVLLMSLGWFYWGAQRTVETIPLPPASLQEEKAKADSAFQKQSSVASRKPEAAKGALAVTNSDNNPLRRPEDTTSFVPLAPVLRTISIRSNPWAYLFLNGDSLGMTPLAVTLAAEATAQRLALKNPQFPLVELALRVTAETSDTLTFSLWEQVAQLELRVTPWAEVYINQEKRGLAEGEKSLVLLPGKYLLRFVHTQLGEKTETISLRAGEVRRLAVNMF